MSSGYNVSWSDQGTATSASTNLDKGLWAKINWSKLQNWTKIDAQVFFVAGELLNDDEGEKKERKKTL